METKIKIKYLKETMKKIRLFGKRFVKNNKKYLKIEIEGEIKELNEFYKNRRIRNKYIDINLIGIEKVTDVSYMFARCPSLVDIINLDTSNFKDMSYMFKECFLLSSLPDISKWNTSNVNDMSEIFYGCSSLLSLPDISKWNTSNVNDMSDMFNGCKESLNNPQKFK